MNPMEEALGHKACPRCGKSIHYGERVCGCDKPTQIGETANNQDPAVIAQKTQDLLMKQSKSLFFARMDRRCS